jgi:hypothetical protein
MKQQQMVDTLQEHKETLLHGGFAGLEAVPLTLDHLLISMQHFAGL